MNAVLRLLNVVFIIPAFVMYMLTYVFYPIIGYILGRGMARSIEACESVLLDFMDTPLQGLKMPLHIYRILVTGNSINTSENINKHSFNMWN